MFIQKQADHREECWLVPKTKAFFTKSSIVDYKYGICLVGKNKDLFRARTVSKRRLNDIRTEFWLVS